jgi:hypothetical protein
MARERIAAHQIEPWVEVRTARLVPYPEHSSTTHWYDQAQIKDIRDIDLFIVDGPPMQVHRLIRAPSLSFFLERRTDDGMMIMDDSSRPGEQEILENWRSRYPNIIVKEIRLEKGAALISVPYNKSVTKISA